MRGAETVTVKRPAETDWQGDPVGEPSSLDLTECQLWPRVSTEDSANGRKIVEGWNVFAPPGQAAVRATDVLRVREEDYQVVGVPGQYDYKGRDKGQIIVVSKNGE
jgi:hypothetical protein